MILSDVSIKKEIQAGNIICTPYDERNVSNSSLDLRLGANIMRQMTADPKAVTFEINDHGKTKVVTENYHMVVDLTKSNYILYPDEFILAETLEYVGQPCSHIVSEVADKSTMARLGLSVCFSAGYIDAGNVLNITLEIKNNGKWPVELQYGQHIAQLKFYYLSEPCKNPYSGKYLNSKEVNKAV